MTELKLSRVRLNKLTEVTRIERSRASPRPFLPESKSPEDFHSGKKNAKSRIRYMAAETAIQTDVDHLLSHTSHLRGSPQLRYHTSILPVSFQGLTGRELLRGAPEVAPWCEPHGS